jgi:hypothetical protein
MCGMNSRSRTIVIHLAVLLVTGGLIRGWIVAHTVVPARDGIGFIGYAMRLQDASWASVIRESHHPPGFPLLIWAVTRFVAECGILLTPESWVEVGQWTAAVAATLAIIPLYLLGHQLFGATAAFVAAWMFQSLPVCLQVTSDVLSEGPFLFFAIWALYWASRALDRGFRGDALSCGAFAGVAYWIRPEGIEIIIVFGLTLLVSSVLKRNWGEVSKSLIAAILGMAPLLAGYVALTGRISNKPTAQQILGQGPEPTVKARCVMGPPIAVFWKPNGNAGDSRALWAAKSVIVETTHTAHGYGLAAAILSIFWFRRHLRHQLVLWLPTLLMVVHLLVLWRMAMVAEYVSERHAILAIVGACLWAGALFADFGRKWRFSVGVCLALLSVVGWPAALKPLHNQRSGFREVGRWLAIHSQPNDEIIDPSSWAAFYAGHPPVVSTRERSPSTGTRFVVLETRVRTHERLHILSAAREAAQSGKKVYCWPSEESPKIVVYQVPASH